MTSEKRLRDELLKQNGVGTQKAEELRDKILARDEAQVRRMKWVAGIAWAVFLTSFLLAALFEFARRHPVVGLRTDEVMALFPEYSWFVPMAIIITQALFILAVALTFSLHVRSRTLTIHQIQARLAGIEEQLRKIAQKD